MPRRANRFGEAAEQPIEESAIVQLRFEFVFVVVAVTYLREHAQDAHQDHNVDDGDQVQEHTRDGGADQAGVVMQGRRVLLDGPDYCLEPEGNEQRQPEHHRRVAEGEEEANGKRPLPVVHQLAGGVVDRGDVVGVECVA
jgi:hypothetical protein